MDTLRSQISPTQESLLENRALPSVLAGSGWFDYRFPSPPDCFVGRDEQLSSIRASIDAIAANETATRVIQVLSRSGVGKSSLLLKVSASAGLETAITVDGRNLLVPADIRLIVAELASRAKQSLSVEIKAPQSHEETEEALRRIGVAALDAGCVVLLQVDQFEAVLSRPRVFQAFLDLVISCTAWRLPIVLVVARKNDLATTYDESSHIDLSRFNELSRKFLLEDFSTTEEVALVDRLAGELGYPLTPALRDMILTFAGGFPWLLKRVCAHVVATYKEGMRQQDLIRVGLRAEDLFAEDLAGLGEQDKALLRTMSAHMPNTASELARRLEGEVHTDRLTLKLNEFLGHKLLRLSGDVYDTYNDVFKAYIITDRIPFQARYVFRVTPGPAMELLNKIAAMGSSDLSSFTNQLGGNRIATINKLRELRLLGLVDPSPGRVALSPEAAAAIDSDSLGDLLRKALRSNALVAKLLDLMLAEGAASFTQATEILHRELPHLDVTNRTLESYVRIMVSWLRYAGIVSVEADTVRIRNTTADDMLSRAEFTLGNFQSGTFVPSVRPGKICELVQALSAQSMADNEIRGIFGNKWSAATVRDARTLHLVEIVDGKAQLSAHGSALVANADDLTRSIAALALSKSNMATLIESAKVGPISHTAQRKIMEGFGSTHWTDQTWKWRLGIISTWLVATGLVKAGRRGLTSISPGDSVGSLF